MEIDKEQRKIKVLLKRLGALNTYEIALYRAAAGARVAEFVKTQKFKLVEEIALRMRRKL